MFQPETVQRIKIQLRSLVGNYRVRFSLGIVLLLLGIFVMLSFLLRAYETDSLFSKNTEGEVTTSRYVTTQEQFQGKSYSQFIDTLFVEDIIAIAREYNGDTETAETNDLGEEELHYRLVIDTPSIHVDAPVVQGVEDEDLVKGVGHHVSTPNPGSTGNVVLAGHQWYPGDNPNYTIFENLDTLQVDDRITVQFKDEEFVYRIVGSKIVDADDTSILEQTEEPILTVYTCTPRYTSKQRLVYTATLETRKKSLVIE